MSPTEGRLLDRYGLVLVLIIATLAVSVVRSDADAWDGLLLALQGFTLVVALSASGFRGLLVRAAAIVTIVGVLGSVLGFTFDIPYSGQVSLALEVLLAGFAPVAIGSRLMKHPQVDGHTVAGALCIYLLVGLFFALVYGLLDRYVSGGALAGPAAGSVQYVYFSFVTLTTLGYGDVTPTIDVARLVAILEALLGQLYLVTVVALIVGNIGRKRP